MQSMMVKVIINADDLGKNSDVNKAIAKAFSDGAISSSTIMANSDSWDEVHKIVEQNPQASFGVHLNLTEGKALTDSPVLHISGIVDNNNYFTKNVRNLSVYTSEIIQAVKDEWFAQIKKVTETEGISVAHIDGHHHIHTFYPFIGILKECLQEFGINKVRNRYIFPRKRINTILHKVVCLLSSSDLIFNLIDRTKNNNSYLNLVYNIIETEKWRKLVSQRYIITEYFDSYEHFCDKIEYLGKDENVTVELMCHPGHPLFKSEFEAIKGHLLEKKINCKLISYNDL